MKVNRPQKERTKSFLLTVPVSLSNQLDNVARKNKAHRAELIRSILLRALEDESFAITLKK